MASRPTPTDAPTEALHRLALRPSDPRSGGRTGLAARGARDLTTALGTGLAARLGDDGRVTGPVGLWPSADGDGEADIDPIIRANPALAAYAAQLRAKRGEQPAAPPRGLPLATRRQRSAVGPGTTPGGLARRAVPVDRVEDPDVVAIVRGRRPGTTPAAAPVASDRRRTR